MFLSYHFAHFALDYYMLTEFGIATRGLQGISPNDLVILLILLLHLSKTFIFTVGSAGIF